MKRIIMFVAAVLMVSTAATAQKASINADKLLKNIAKSDATIADAKKAANVSNWLTRGKLFYDAEVEVSKNLIPGFLTETTMQTMLGRPKTRTTEDINGVTYNVRTYPPYVTAYFDATTNMLFAWKVTPIYEGAVDKAIEAYSKARELDTKNKQVKKIGEGFKSLFDELSKQATNEYNLGNYGIAGDLFAKAFEVGQLAGAAYVDENTLGQAAYNAGLTYSMAHNYAASKDSFARAVAQNFTDEGNTYVQLYRAYRGEYDAIEGESDEKTAIMKEAKTILETGLAAFPSNESIMSALAEVYNFLGEDPKTIINVIKSAIENTPENINLWIGLASIYQNQADWDNAVDAMKKVDELQPNNAAVLYFIGAFYYEKGNEVSNRINMATYSSQKEFDEAKKEYEAIYMQALEVLEKSHSINPTDPATLDMLKAVTFRLRDLPGIMDKYQQYADALNALM